MAASHQSSYNSGLKALTAPRGLVCIYQHIMPLNHAEALAGEGTCLEEQRGGQLHHDGLCMQKG